MRRIVHGSTSFERSKVKRGFVGHQRSVPAKRAAYASVTALGLTMTIQKAARVARPLQALSARRRAYPRRRPRLR